MMVLLMGMHFQSNVFAYSEHNKDTNVIKMADIVITIQHYATVEDKKNLQAIVDSNSSTAHEKIISTAIINIKHQATSEDKQKLQAIIDSTAPISTIRNLATVVSQFSHKISAEGKRKLKQ